MTCYEFAIYSARSGGKRTGTLRLKDLTQIIALSWGTETDPNDMFVMEMALFYGKSYLVQYLPADAALQTDGQGLPIIPEPNTKSGNQQLLDLFCPPDIQPK